MEVNCIIKGDGLLTEEGKSTVPKDSLLESEDEIQTSFHSNNSHNSRIS